jgi:hypothetical protein
MKSKAKIPASVVGLGDVVIFRTEDGDELPAMVTRVLEDGSLNLYVFHDGAAINQYPQVLVGVLGGEGPLQWRVR